jgi:hypothetical protein
VNSRPHTLRKQVTLLTLALCIALLAAVPLIGGSGNFAASQQGYAAASSGADMNDLPSLPAITQNMLAADTTRWQSVERTYEGVTFSYRYPPGWSQDLAFCAPGARTQNDEGGHLPAGCASTDLLVAQKARDVGRIQGDRLTLSGRSATRAVVTSPPNILVSRIYTVMLYDASGQPLFGFTTQIGHDTAPATIDSIVASLDDVVSTLRVEVSR